MEMKKYLLAAALAVAVSGAFVSCHEDEISGSMIEQKAKAFETTFIEAFGQPAPNHTWGFKRNIIEGSGVTRGEIDANGNEWTDAPSYGPTERHYKNASGETVTGDIYNYVNREADGTWKYYTEFPDNIENYYVSQIFEGDAKYRDYNEIRNNGKNYFVGSDKMDYLVIADKRPSTINRDPGTLDNADNWFHIYDFNSANNTDYNGHMRVRNAGTLNFAYWNSLDSKFHDKWIAVDGADIDDQYKDYWYICFDFEAIPVSAPDNYTEIQWKVPGQNPNEWYEQKTQLRGAWTLEMLEAKGTKLHDTMTGRNTGEYTVNQKNTKDWTITQVSKGDKLVPGNEIYTDWIVRITKAKTEPTEKWKIIEAEEVVEAGRVFCEDLGASSLNDVDYNDVVFDAIIVHEYCKLITTTIVDGEEVTTETTDFSKDGKTGYSRTYAKVCLLAAGGTIPAAVCGHEVHDVLSNSTLGTTVMINTAENSENLRGAQVATCSPVIIQETVGSETTDKIYINGNNKAITCIDDIDIDVRYGNAVTEITALTGAVPYKICVPIGTPWAKERINIGIAFTSFGDYCKTDPTIEFWKDINKEGSPVWDDCGSLFTIKNDGVTRWIVESDFLSYNEETSED